MSSASISKDTKIYLKENEKEVLIKAYEILEELGHELFVEDDESDEYWSVDATLFDLKEVLSSAGVAVKY